MPVYNGSSYVTEAIESVLGQTFQDFELLLFDDGSSDASLEMLRRYESEDARIRVFTRENRGLVETLNELIEIARGRYFARMDADDVCLPRRFEKQIAFLDMSPDHVVVGTWIEQMTADGQPIGVVRCPLDHKSIDTENLKGHCSIWHPAAMIRGEVFRATRGYDPAFENAEDLDLWLRLAEIGKLANLPEVLLKYRMHGRAISEEKGLEQQIAAKRACEATWKRRRIEGHFEAVGHWRPRPDRVSRHEFALKYGWTAWAHGHRDTWRTYARQALRLRPFAWSSWNLLIFGFLRSPGH